MFKSRKYKSGTKWCLWRWTEVHSEYISRLHVIKTPWWAVCVHWLKKADPEPYLHDHPVSFLSLILRGGYTETVQSEQLDDHCLLQGSYVWTRSISHRWFNLVPASEHWRHTITYVRPGTITLCFMGPKTREWGFHKPEGWQLWKDYYAELRGKK